MTKTVAACAEEVALVDLREEALTGAPEVADAEFLHRCVAVMELERRETD